MRSKSDSRIEPERQRLHEVFAIAHPHVSRTPDGGDELGKRLGDRQPHAKRARVIVPVSAWKHTESRTLGPRDFHEPLNDFVNGPVSSDGKNGVVGDRR